MQLQIKSINHLLFIELVKAVVEFEQTVGVVITNACSGFCGAHSSFKKCLEERVHILADLCKKVENLKKLEIYPIKLNNK